MDIVGKITSYARAVPAGLRAAGQELAKTASAATDGDLSAPVTTAPARRRKKRTVRPAAARRATGKRAKAKRPKAKRAKAKRPAAGKKRRAKR